MSSVFSLVTESADSTDTLSTAAPVSNTAGLEEGAMEDFAQAEAAGQGADELMDGQDKVIEIHDEVQSAMESGGLSPKGLQYLQLSLRNIVGKAYANKKLPSMESAHSTDAVTLTAIALEGIKETIVQFWTAIKNQVGKFWKMTKDWYIKTFDVANKIIARAKALNEKSNSLNSAPTEKSFSMGGTTLLSVNYQIKDPNVCIAGYEALKVLVDNILISVSKQNQNDKSEKILGVANKLFTDLKKVQVGQQTDGTTNVDDLFLDDMPRYESLMGTPGNDPEMRKKLGIDNNTTYVMSKSVFPGNKSFIICANDEINKTRASEWTVDNFIETFKSFRYLLGDTAAKPKTMEDENDVKTLVAGQVVKIADISEELGQTILKFKKEYDARDRFIQKVVKGFDQIMKDVEAIDGKAPAAAPGQAQESADPAQPQPQPQPTPPAAGTQQPAPAQNTPNPTPAAQPAAPNTDKMDKQIRKLSQAVLGLFKKNMQISGAVISHATKCANAFLTYGEQSCRQYGSV